MYSTDCSSLFVYGVSSLVIFSVLFHILSSEGRVCGCNVLDILEGGGMQDTQ